MRVHIRSVLTGAAVFVFASCGSVRITSAPVQPFHPSIEWGGRAVAVAVHPAQPAFMIAASASGGLFRSDTRGRTWVHTVAGPGGSVSVQDVEYVPAQDRIRVVATTGIELQATSTGGIWLSRNGGLTYSRPATALPAAGPRCPERTAAYGIAVEPGSGRVYVGTDCGYAWSDDGGDSWSHKVIDPTVPVIAGLTQDRILNIVASGSRVYALGRNGLYYSANSGTDWSRAGTPTIRNILFRDAPPRLSISPVDPMHAFLAIDRDSAMLYVTTNGGAAWSRARADEDKARQAIVRTTPHNYAGGNAAGYTLYWGNGEALFRAQVSDLAASAGRFSWQDVATDHADIMDVAFDGGTGEPLLLASDGGVHLTRDQGASWEVTGVGSGGFNALQVYGIAGQFKNSAGTYDHTDLYFGTQDNGLWYSSDGGRIWQRKNDPEGGGLDTRRSVDDYSDTWITGYRCAPCYTFLTREHFRDSRVWRDAGDEKNSQPMHVGGTRFIQFGTDTTHTPGVDSLPARRAQYLYRSDNLDAAWAITLQIDRAVFGSVKRSGAATNPWLTYGIRTGWNPDGSRTIELRSVSRAAGARTEPQLYHASRDFGSLGNRGYQFEWTPIFGVHPSNPNFIIAPDITDGTIKVSTDGGESWVEDVALKEAVTESGRFDLYARYNNGEAGGLLVNEISFLPENPNHILVGMKYNGIVHSADGGLTWSRIPGSERIPHITGFFWDFPNDRVVVSTFGRGLWTVRFGDGELGRVPDSAREIPPPDPDRAPLRWRPRTTGVRAEGSTAVGGMALVRSGADLVITGAGFAPSPDQQMPVRFVLEDRVIAEAFPAANGRFSIRLPVQLPTGSYDLEIVQDTPDGRIREALSFVVAAWGQRDGGDNR